MAEELGTLFLVVGDATVLQLRQDLDQHFSEQEHHNGEIEVAKATKVTNGGKCYFPYRIILITQRFSSCIAMNSVVMFFG